MKTQILSPGDRVKITNTSSRFDGWIGTITETYRPGFEVSLDREPSPIYFTEAEIEPMVVS